jgi:hypothetical protein
MKRHLIHVSILSNDKDMRKLEFYDTVVAILDLAS